MGSGGGGSEGGAGGAYLYLKVYETLTLEGHIKVDGQAGQGEKITFMLAYELFKYEKETLRRKQCNVFFFFIFASKKV